MAGITPSVPWYQEPITVPYGNPNYDKAMGGSHDMDFGVPVDTPITAIQPGTIVDVSAPAWGKQVGIKLDKPIGNVPYYAFLHLDAVDPSISLGRHVNSGDLIGWSGGANSQAQIGMRSNPTGTHFLNPAEQSSQPQIGLALMYGPKYGSGAGWISDPEHHPELNPTQLLTGARTTTTAPGQGANAGNTPQTPGPAVQQQQLPSFAQFFGIGNLPDDFWTRVLLVGLGAVLIFIGMKGLISGGQQITVNVPKAQAAEKEE